MSVTRAEAALATIGKNLTLRGEPGQCDGCLERTRTFRLDPASPDTPPRVDVTTRRRLTQNAILQYLGEHAGKVFCADCISTRLFDGKNIDVAMRHLEGNRLARRHAICAGCGKRRLVAGLA